MELQLERLSSIELKTLIRAAENEKRRRGRRSPDNHDSPKWVIPNKAVKKPE